MDDFPRRRPPFHRPAPWGHAHDPALPLSRELPAEYYESELCSPALGGVRLAHLRTPFIGMTALTPTLYFCPRCPGWVPGYPGSYDEDTFAPHQLAGRRGTVTYCLRCGEEIAFLGLVS